MADTPLYASAAFQSIAGGTWRPGGTALTRHALELCAFAPGSDVLDIGCGKGASLALARELGLNGTGLDRENSLAEPFPFVQADAQNPPFPDASFDGILCECVLSLLPDAGQALHRFAEILRPNGRLLLSDLFLRGATGPAERTPGFSCLAGARTRQETEYLLAENGFTLLHFEDHTASLKELAARLPAFGFNVVRIHHHDNEIYDRGGNNPSRIDPERVDRLDYLLACLKKRGIYYTTDVYVSRRNIPAAELGSIGAIASPAEYKALFYINDDVYADWERWAKAFLTRVNPHTGLALKDDPALITLSLVNEGNPDSWWNRSPRAMPLYNARFAEWKKTHTNGTFVEFLSELTSGRYRQMAEFLRGLGCRALLTDQNFLCNLPLAASRSLYDFVDNHAYWDHPRFAEKPWQLPVLPSQSHPLAARPGIPGQLMPSRIFGKPFTVSEFDYANPNQFRAVGPALMAAYAAFQAWDGLFPFAYAHSLNAVTNPANTRGFFDIATDPVKTFSQRLGARLFLHGGIRPAERAFAAVATSPFRKGAEAEAPLPFSDLGFLARIGLATALPLPENRVAALIDIGTGAAPAGGNIPSFTASEKLIPDLIRAGLLPQGCFDAASGRFTAPGGQLELNRKQRTLRITAPGGEVLAPAVGKTLQGRLLAVEHSSVPAVFALLPVDGDKLDSARRMTLFHLTNTQATGMKFGNAHLDRLESWGKLPFLARRGTAQVTLRLPRGNWELYALDTAGKRIARVTPETAPEGALRLALDNARYPEAVFVYELIRK